MPTANILDTRTVTTTDHYHGWPTVARLRDGRLMAVCSGGRDLHVCPFGQVRLIESDDDGETWSDERILADGPLDDRDSGIVQTPSGVLCVFWFTSYLIDHYRKTLAAATAPDGEHWMDAARQARWRDRLAQLDAMTESQIKAELGCWMIRSDDGGRTWSARSRVPVNAPHGAVVLDDGRLFYAGREVFQGSERCAVVTSADDGRTWSDLTILPVGDGHDAAQYHELHAVHADNGDIIVQIRNHNEDCKFETLQLESTDGGASWTRPHSIGVWGYPSHLMKLRDGRLLMTYGYRNKPIGNQARLSSDHGRSWSEPMWVSRDASNWDLGYPSSVELGDGSILSLWYECINEQAPPDVVLRIARWRIED